MALGMGAVYTYNHWPREIEADLWTEKDLNLPPVPENNGWDLLPEREDRKNENLNFDIGGIEDNALRDKLENIFRVKGGETAEEDEEQTPEIALTDLAPFSQQIFQLVQKNKELLNRFENILNAEHFVDASAIDPFAKTRKETFLFKNWHDIGYLFIIDKALQQNWKAAYPFWHKMFRKDLDWAYSSRNLLGTLLTLDCLKKDVALLGKMNTFQPLSHFPEIVGALQNIEWEKISIERPIVAEYLWQIMVLDLLNPNKIKKAKDIWAVWGMVGLEEPSAIHQLTRSFVGVLYYLYARIFYNEAYTKEAVNDGFRECKKWLKNQALIPEDSDYEKELRKHYLENLLNRFGRAQTMPMNLNFGRTIRRIYLSKENLREQSDATRSSL